MIATKTKTRQANKTTQSKKGLSAAQSIVAGSLKHGVSHSGIVSGDADSCEQATVSLIAKTSASARTKQKRQASTGVKSNPPQSIASRTKREKASPAQVVGARPGSRSTPVKCCPRPSSNAGRDDSAICPLNSEGSMSDIPRLRELQAWRNRLIRTMIFLDNQARSFARRALGFQWDMSAEQRAEVRTRAKSIVADIRKGKPCDPEIAAVEHRLRLMLGNFADLEVERDLVEATMEKIAESFPATEWSRGVNGLSLMGLAKIVGEAGDLNQYPNPRHLRKRLGLAPKHAYAMETKAGASANAVPRQRLSQMWIIGDQFIKKNTEPYRGIYDARKAFEMAKDGMTKMHAHKRAVRVMLQKFLNDLWGAWTGKQLVSK